MSLSQTLVTVSHSILAIMLLLRLRYPLHTAYTAAWLSAGIFKLKIHRW